MRAGKVGTGLEDGKPRRMEAAGRRGGKANGHPERSFAGGEGGGEGGGETESKDL